MADHRTNAKKAPTIRDYDSTYERENRKIVGETNSNPLLNGVLLKSVSIGTGTTQIAHRLGRPFVGFIVVDASAPAMVSRDTSVTAQFDTYISLKASAAATFSLWVF